MYWVKRAVVKNTITLWSARQQNGNAVGKGGAGGRLAVTEAGGGDEHKHLVVCEARGGENRHAASALKALKPSAAKTPMAVFWAPSVVFSCCPSPPSPCINKQKNRESKRAHLACPERGGAAPRRQRQTAAPWAPARSSAPPAGGKQEKKAGKTSRQDRQRSTRGGRQGSTGARHSQRRPSHCLAAARRSCKQGCPAPIRAACPYTTPGSIPPPARWLPSRPQ